MESNFLNHWPRELSLKSMIYGMLIFVFSISKIVAQQSDIHWPTLAKSAWPMIKHDPQFTGRSPYKGPQTATIARTADMPNGIFSGPVIGAQGNLYFGSYYQLDSADHFYSFSLDEGMVWDFRLGTNRPPQSGILIDSSNTVYFGSLDQYFYALNRNGTLKWKYMTGHITEIVVPNIDLQGKVYITNNPEGELVSINPEGTLNWKVKYDEGFLEKSPAISPDGNTIYIAGRDSNLYALNLNGTVKWIFKCAQILHLPLVDSQGYIYIIPGGPPQSFYSIDPGGNLRWKNKIIQGAIPIYAAPTVDYDGNLYVICQDSTTTVFSNRSLISYSKEGSYRWIYNFEFASTPDDFFQPLICDSEGTVYLGSTYGSYYYAISRSGELKWKLPLNGYQVDNTGAIASDGTLYLGVHKSSLQTNLTRTLIAVKDSGTTGVDNYSVSELDDYKLERNYPNPFNPTTTIEYSLPVRSRVRLHIFNILGQRVSTLCDGEQTAGYQKVKWNANAASGIYFYRIEATAVNDPTKHFIDSKKMLLIR